MDIPIDEQNKSDDKKGIEMEEKEQMLNGENKVQDKVTEMESVPTSEADKETKSTKTDNKEGREVQPKKIPIGGIQMPGFFTRCKSKEKSKEGESAHGDVEGTELLEPKEKEAKEEAGTHHARIKLPNPFRKSKVASDDEAEKAAEPKEKKRLLDAIRLPLVSVFPRKRKEEQNLESQVAVAGLASMETLDENDKSADKKEDDLKNVSLEIDEKKELQKQESEESTWKQKLKAYRVIISALLVFVLIVIILIAIAIPGKPTYTIPIRDGKYVETITSCGRVEGKIDDSAVAFRGIPYARPPEGNFRFKPAQPFDKLEYCWNDTLPTHNATDYCWQIYGNGTSSGTEDCLTLDVVTPYVRYDSPLPVIVLIGADSFIGGSPGKMRPSARYARSFDVVFVRPNFRVGVLGFLALNMLNKRVHPPTSGNYGLTDIVEALKWVQLNIEHFGGDPKSVTLFGHKAGATLVTALATMRGAEKLFSRVWASSGGAIYPGKPLAESEMENESFLSNIMCEDVDCLLKTESQSLVNAVSDTWRKPPPDLPTKTEDPEKRHQWLTLDGKYLQEHPGQIWADEKGLPVPLVIGTTIHAGASEKLFLKYTNWTEELVKKHVSESLLGKLNLSDEALSLYPNTYQGLSAMITDIRILCPLLAISTQMRNATFYVVTETRGEHKLADIDSDVDAIFGRYEPKTPEQRRYVSAMQQQFYDYVRYGKVRQMQGHTNKVLVIGQDAIPAHNYTQCNFWIPKNIVPNYAQLD